MKKLVVLFVVMVSFASFANAKPSPSLKKEIRTKIVKLLGKANFDVENELSTNVDLLVNKKGQIIILDINSKDQNVINFITSKLNYKKVVQGLQKDVTLYKMSVKVVND